MELSKNEHEKCDLKSPKISKPNEKTITSSSKIPKRNLQLSEKTSTTAASRLLNKPNKQVDSKKPSRSMMSLNPPKSARPLLSSRSHINTQKNILTFETSKEKVRKCQTEFMRKWDVVKNDLPPEKGEYKLIGLVKDNDVLLVTKDTQKIKLKCDTKTLDELKKDMQNIHSNLNPILDSLDKLKNLPGKIGDSSIKGPDSLTVAIEDIKKKLKTNSQTPLADMLKQLENVESSVNSKESTASSELETRISNLLKESDEIRKCFDLSQKELMRIKKSAEEKDNLYRKNSEELEKKFNKKKLENDEMKKKLESLEKVTSKDKIYNKELQEKYNKMTTEVEDLKKRLETSTQLSHAQQAKSQALEAQNKKIEAELKALKDAEKHSIGDQASKHADEIKAIKGNLVSLKNDKETLEKEVQSYKLEIEKSKELDNQLVKLKAQAKRVDSENQILRETIKDLENKIQANESLSLVTKDVYEEISKLKQSESISHQRIDLLEMELTKTRFQNKKLEEKITMDRKLLDVRSSLIDSLQNKEKTQKIHIKDLFAEVDGKNNDIQKLKTELLTKTEEFQNLFSTLSTKQLELTRQEHMIKLLQESNERAQALRVKQEAKIARLEEEIVNLKQTISLYQDAILPSNELRRNLLMAEAAQEADLGNNLGYFIDERRRKRHIDINVKKYEK